MGGWIVTNLRSLVKVLRTDPDGKQLMEPTGAFDSDGKPIITPSTRTVSVKKGDPLPSGLADGEIERLQKLNAIRQVAGLERVIGEQEQPSAPSGVTLDLIGAATTEELTAWIASGEAPGVKKILEAVGHDKELAQRLLDAEKTALKDDARSTMVAGLERVIGAGE